MSECRDIADSPVAAAPKARVAEVDVLRVIGALAVVYIHATARAARAAYAIDPTQPMAVASELADFAVPAFILIAAGLAWSKDPKDGYLAFLGRRAAAIGVPYILWTAIYLTIAWSDGTAPKAFGAAAYSALSALLTGSSSYQLYFVPIVFVLYALTPLFRPLTRWSPEAALVASIIARYVASRWDGNIERFGTDPLLVSGVPGVVKAALVALPFAGLGAWYLSRLDLARVVLRYSWPAWLIGSFGIDWARVMRLVGFSIAPFGMMAELVGLLGVSGWISRLRQPLMTWIGMLAPLTYGVYLGHPLLLIAAHRITDATSSSWLWETAWFALLTWAVVAVLSFGLVSGLKRLPVLKHLT